MSTVAVVVRRVRVLALLLGVAVLAGAAPVEGQAARVLGRITDGVGNPVPQARVALVAEGAQAPAHETVSGQTGGFQFAGVVAGTYVLRATRDGYGMQERRITVRPGEVVSQVVRLRTGRAAGQVVSAVRSSGQ
jgi:hypothetical protein